MGKILFEPMDFFGSAEEARAANEKNPLLPSLKKNEAKAREGPTEGETGDGGYGNKVEVNLAQALATTNQSLRQPELPQCGVAFGMGYGQSGFAVNVPVFGVPGVAERRQSKDNVGPYRMMEKVARSACFAVWKGKLYCFQGRYYEHVEQDEALGMILDYCRAEVAQTERFSDLQGVFRFMMVDNRLKLEECRVEDTKQYLTFRNGVLNIRTGLFQAHSPEIFTMFELQCNYLGVNCGVSTPVFDMLLWQMTGGNGGMIERLWQILGYCLTPDTGGKCGFLLQGVGDSGKSVYANFLQSFFPEQRISAIGVHDLCNNFAKAQMEGVSLCVSPDLPAEKLRDKTVGIMKALSGNDMIEGDKKHKDFRKFRFEGKFLMMGNGPLLTKHPDKAFERRIVAVPFYFSVPREKQDPFLLERLAAERDAVASKAVDAYYRLRANHYVFAGSYELNSAAVLYENPMDDNRYLMVMMFVRQEFERDEGGQVFTSDAWKIFCENHGFVALHVFGRDFLSASKAVFKAKEGRERKEGERNPTSCVYGIRFRGEN